MLVHALRVHALIIAVTEITEGGAHLVFPCQPQ